jgi:hypothetical protein
MAFQGVFDTLNGLDIEIQFCLAARTPSGDSTNGIMRYAGNAFQMWSNADGYNFSTANSWNTSNYFNIYVWDGICGFPVLGCVGGYASFPSSHGDKTDGIHLVRNSFGLGFARTPAHEAGHYLGLYHTFNGGCINNDCLADGDRVCDTPPDNLSTNWPINCDSVQNSCHTDTVDSSINNPFRSISLGGLGDQNDPTRNFMDYISASCSNMFTVGQKDRMRSSLLTIRHSLLESKGCQDPCPNPINPQYTMNVQNYFYDRDTLVLTNSTTGANSYIWSINNTPIATSQDTFINLDSIGGYNIKLCAFNSDTNCTQCTSEQIDVRCSVANLAIADKLVIEFGESIQFTGNVSHQNTQTSPTTFKWYLDSTLIGSNPNINYQFNTPGAYVVTSVMCNGNCCAEKQFLIEVRCNNSVSIDAQTNTFIAPGDSIYFLNNSSNTISQEWFVNGVLLSDSLIFAHRFDTPGSYWIKLIAFNGVCTDSAFTLVQVNDCSNKEAYNWCFSDNNWLSFEDSLHYKSGSQLSNDASATISDVDGNLLLYSDGILYNRHHQVIPSTVTGITGAYNNSTLILRKPGSGHEFYNISINSFGALRYVLLDVAADRGNGMQIGSLGIIQNSEKRSLSAVSHCNDKDVWLISKDAITGNYNTYLISDTGISNPVVSSYVDSSNNFVQGCIKFSPNGRHVAVSSPQSTGIELFDFDNKTGMLFNYRHIDTSIIISEVEFSSTSKFLYGAKDGLYQYNLSLEDSLITNSKIIIDSSIASFDNMQIGPDHKIYVFQTWNNSTTAISVINRPDSLGINSNYTKDYFPLPNNNRGLPMFNQSLFNSEKSLTLSTANDTILIGTSVFVAVMPSECQLGQYSYAISSGGSILQIVDSGVFVSFSTIGDHNITLTKESYCDTIVENVNLFVVAPSGMDNFSANNISIIPNPSKGVYKINFSDNKSKRLRLVDVKGNVIFEVNNVTNSHQVDLTGYPNGVYFLDVFSNQSSNTYRMIKIE